MKMTLDTLGGAVKPLVDLSAIGTLLATLNALLPPIAALVTIIWMLLRIYEMRTVQKWLGKSPTMGPDEGD